MLNSVTNNAVAPIQKQAVQNSTKSDNDFQSALNKQIFADDGSFILDKNVQVIKPKEHRPVTTQEVQSELGISEAEAEKILKELKLVVPVDYSFKEGEVSIKDLVEGSRLLKEMIATSEKNQLHDFVINDVLTANDKKLVEAATGGLQPTSSSGLHEVNQLATRIALDRTTGTLSGEVDENYINKLLAEQDKNQNSEMVSFSALQKSLTFLQQERTDFFKRVKPDFTNMTPNEFGELTKSGRFPELLPIVLPKGLDLTKDSKIQMESSLNTKVNYIDMLQKQIEFNKSIGESTTYLDNVLNLMKNFNV